MSSTELFRNVLLLAGLAPLIGPGMLRRALADVGTTPENASIKHYRSALPGLEARMRAYHSPTEATGRIKGIAGYLDVVAKRGEPIKSVLPGRGERGS
jgi:hypothetical protein